MFNMSATEDEEGIQTSQFGEFVYVFTIDFFDKLVLKLQQKLELVY